MTLPLSIISRRPARPNRASTTASMTRASAFFLVLLVSGLAAPVADTLFPSALAQSPTPDFNLAGITVSDAQTFPMPGDTIQVKVTMINEQAATGFADRPAGSAFRIRLQDSTTGTVEKCVAFNLAAAWPAGATLEHTFAYTVPANAKLGPHRVLLTLNKKCTSLEGGGADPYAEIDESSVVSGDRRGNNQRNFTIVVGEKPNLELTNLRWCAEGSDTVCTPIAPSQTSYDGAEKQRLSVKITNRGYAPAGINALVIPRADVTHARPSDPPGTDISRINYATVAVKVAFSVVQMSNGTALRTVATEISDFASPVFSSNFPLIGMAGRLDLRAIADPDLKFPDADRDLSKTNRSVYINGVELVASHDDSVLNAGQYNVVDKVNLRFVVNNTGELAIPQGRSPVPVRLYYDGATRRIEHANLTDLVALAEGDSKVYELTVNLVATKAEENLALAKAFAGGGRHTVNLHVDSGNGRTVGDGQRIFEANEANNVGTASIIVADTLSPIVTSVLTDPPILMPGEPTSIRGGNHRTGDKVRFEGTVADNDPTLDTVWVNVTRLDGNISTHPMTRVPGSTSESGTTARWEATLATGYNTAGTYPYTVCARDPASNPTKCTPGAPLVVKNWPNQRVFLDDATWGSIRERDNGSVILPLGRVTPSAPWDVPIFFKQEDYQVGIPGGVAGNNGEGKRLRIWAPGDTPGTVSYYEFSESTNPGLFAKGACTNEADPATCTNRFIFGTQYVFGAPGPLHMVLETKDKVGLCNCTHWFFYLDDYAPEVFNVLSEPFQKNVGDVLTFRYNVSDRTALQETDVTNVHLNFTLPSVPGFYKNISLVRATNNKQYTDGNGDPVFRGEWKLNVTTGAAGTLPYAGLGHPYDYTVAMRDKWGNWGHRFNDFTLRDTSPPQLISFTTSALKEEAGKLVNFTVQATDNAALQAFLRVHRAGSGEIVVNRTKMLGPVNGNTYYLLRAFNESGIYNYQVEVTDGTTVVERPAKSFEISKNIEPRVRFDGFARRNDTRYYASADPRAEILVYDSEGIARDTIKVLVDGNVVGDWSAVPITVPGNGYRVYYNFSAFTLKHGDIVNLSVEAADASPESLLLSGSAGAFTFRVDGNVPRTTLAKFTPHYLRNVTENYFVSPRTTFTLATEDDGKVAASYLLVGKGGSKQIIEYTGAPVLFSNFTDVCCRPGVYTIQFWSRDDVGNEEPRIVGGPNEVIVQLDDLPPRAAKDDVVTAPWVNVTLLDDGSGVKSANLLVEVRTPGKDPVRLAPIPMRFEEPWWRGKLPDDAATVPRGSAVHYSIEAIDNVDNKQVFDYPAWATGNRPPTARFTAPTSGAEVTGVVTFRWQATDPDGDPVHVILETRGPGEAIYKKVFETDSANLYDVDASKLAVGEHAYRITATDPHNASQAVSISIKVKKSLAPVSITPVPQERVRPGDLIYVFARVNQPATTVKALLFLGAEPVGSVLMKDDGDLAGSGDRVANDGIYTAGFKLERAGVHRVAIEVEYTEGGETKTYTTDAGDIAFDVQYAAADVFTYNPGLWGAIGFLTLAVIAVGVFAIVRRRGGA